MPYEFDEKTIAQMDYYSRLAGALRQYYFANRQDQGDGRNLVLFDTPGIPNSIVREYSHALTMLHILEGAAHPVWNLITTSDGYKIDGHQQNNYETSLKTLTELREANAQHINQEEINAYEFPPVDTKALNEQLNACTTYREAETFVHNVRQDADLNSFANRQTIREEFLKDAQEVVMTKPTQIQLDIEKIEKDAEDRRLADEAAAAEKRENSFFNRAKSKVLDIVNKIRGRSEEEDNEQQDEMTTSEVQTPTETQPQETQKPEDIQEKQLQESQKVGTTDEESSEQ